MRLARVEIRKFEQSPSFKAVVQSIFGPTGNRTILERAIFQTYHTVGGTVIHHFPYGGAVVVIHVSCGQVALDPSVCNTPLSAHPLGVVSHVGRTDKDGVQHARSDDPVFPPGRKADGMREDVGLSVKIDRDRAYSIRHGMVTVEQGHDDVFI